MRAWIRENSNLTMGEMLRKAEEAIHVAETSDSGSGSIQTEEDESLYEFQAAIAVAITSLTTALRPWPHIQQLARLSPEVLELPSSNFDDQAPAVMVILEVILPAPEAKLTPVQSRASGVQAPEFETGRVDTDKPPAPFIYTPWTLFAKSQNMIMRGKMWTDACRHFNTELNRLYPQLPNDLAAEFAATEGRGIDAANPFSETLHRYGGAWSSRALDFSRGLQIDTAHRRQSSFNTIGSPGYISSDSDETDPRKSFGIGASVTSLQQTSAPESGRRTRPNTAATEGGIKKGLSALVSRAKESVAPDVQNSAAHETPGPPVYNDIRGKTDQ